jgi:hypothetical protein
MMTTTQSIGQILSQVKPSTFTWFEDEPLYSLKAKKDEQIYNVKTDVLAHIIAALEAEVPIWEIGTEWKDAVREDPNLDFLKVTPLLDHHKSRAAMIRRYYRNRLTLQSFKEQGMSQFRKDLYDFLTMPEHQLRLSYLPMMLRLPAFYLEDVTVDDLVNKYKMPNRSKQLQYAGNPEVRTLRFVDRTYRKTKNQNVRYYWFADETDMLHRLAIEETNKLRHVFERFLHSPVSIEAKYPVSVIKGRDVSYYSIEGDWRLL